MRQLALEYGVSNSTAQRVTSIDLRELRRAVMGQRRACRTKEALLQLPQQCQNGRTASTTATISTFPAVTSLTNRRSSETPLENASLFSADP